MKGSFGPKLIRLLEDEHKPKLKARIGTYILSKVSKLGRPELGHFA